MTFDVGGVLLDRPFKVRRLGHYQSFSRNVAESRHFYCDLLGFQITDTVDFSSRIQSAELADRIKDPNIYFTRYNTDHHSFIFSSPELLEIIYGTPSPEAGIGQITWQVGSIREVSEGQKWFEQAGLKILRSGRDMPGSNWHSYVPDPDDHPNEIYYGIEQIGWNGLSKPASVHDFGWRTPFPVPQIPEYMELTKARERGDDLLSGQVSLENRPATYDVDGILLPRPFKIVGIGPIRLLTSDMNASLAFYRDQLGLVETETVTWRGHVCHFLRCNTEHHSMALYPEAIRDELPLVHPSKAFALGLRVNNYEQLRAAIAYLKTKGCEVLHLPTDLSPGLNHTAFIRDPGGHLVQLYWEMEQIGWDGKPRPPAERRAIEEGNWPERLDSLSDSFGGEQMLGPWA